MFPSRTGDAHGQAHGAGSHAPAEPAGGALPKRSGHTVLVVDDERESLSTTRLHLERDGHRVLTAESGAAALAVLGRESVQLVVVDYYMPGMDGEQLIRLVRERDPLVHIVLQTEKPPRDLLRRLAIQGFHDRREGTERLALTVDLCLRTADQIAQLRVADRVKTELLGNVSHELRTPLNVILGYLDLLRDGAFGTCAPEAMGILEKLTGQAGYLLELVEEFLDLSRLEAAPTGTRRESVDLAPMLRELAESFALLVRTKPVHFVADIPESLPVVAAEGAKIRVVIQNLLANAEKFTEQGQIRLAAAAVPGGRVAVRVSDTGPGIAREHQQAIFDIFHQLRPAAGGAKGVGLGLALARRFARAMGGDITVESTPGKGSTFTVTLPASGGGPRTATAAA